MKIIVFLRWWYRRCDKHNVFFMLDIRCTQTKTKRTLTDPKTLCSCMSVCESSKHIAFVWVFYMCLVSEIPKNSFCVRCFNVKSTVLFVLFTIEIWKTIWIAICCFSPQTSFLHLKQKDEEGAELAKSVKRGFVIHLMFFRCQQLDMADWGSIRDDSRIW